MSHNSKSGVAHFAADDEEQCLKDARSLGASTPVCFGRLAKLSSAGRGFESRPTVSTPHPSCRRVGAHRFRNLFGSYMQRAAAGETFLITRRGKPYVGLGPAADQST